MIDFSGNTFISSHKAVSNIPQDTTNSIMKEKRFFCRILYNKIRTLLHTLPRNFNVTAPFSSITNKQDCIVYILVTVGSRYRVVL